MRLLAIALALAAAAPAHAKWSLRHGALADFIDNITHPCHFPIEHRKFDASKWALTWSDEFDGKGDPSCYSRPAQCQNQPYWGLTPCPAASQKNLQKLNKCNWTIYNYPNYMFQAVNDFSAEDVTVENGMLVLTSRAKPAGSPGMAFSAGGLDGAPHPGQVNGFAQQYGRFEVRAKLPRTPGSWPAHWLMPSEGNQGWPADGEIDIMESFGGKTKRVAMTLHWADNGHQDHLIGCALNVKKDFADDFHVFAVEWEPGEMRWYVDEYLVGTQSAKHKNAHGSRIQIPKHPFYWILNTTLSTMGGGAALDPKNFPVGKHYIDYVRVYRHR